MVSAAFAKKLGMTHIYDDQNRHVPVTILSLADQTVTHVRTQAKDGYDAVQIGAAISKNIAKPQKAELEKKNISIIASRRHEVSIGTEETIELGQPITVTNFSPGDEISVTGTSKGKGFSGGIKRHGWSRGPMSHGSKHHRAPGSIGSGYPQRVVPGKKLPGHMGHETVTTKGHKVVAINEANNTLALSGPIPGPTRSYVFIRKGE